ncbi:MAG: M48 family metallopeptidase [Candidatus Velthaea sp.]
MLTRIARCISLAALILAAVALPGSAAQTTPNPDQEQQLGAELFDQLRSEAEIVKSSPLYATLDPIAKAITAAVQPGYPYPIHFYIVHEAQPNAFAAPGGNVYVVDALFDFVKNREELAGTLCHETSHLLHHDSIKMMKDRQKIARRAVAATILLGPSVGTVLAAGAIGELDANHYSRDIEEQADLTGAETCARAGFNPWGLVWLFDDFSKSDLKSPPEFLSNHPDDAHREQALKALFRAKPDEFARFDSDPVNASKLNLPAEETEVFLRPSPR